MGIGDDNIIHDMLSVIKDDLGGFGHQTGSLIRYDECNLEDNSEEILCISPLAIGHGRGELITVETKFRDFCTPPSRHNSIEGLLLKGVENRDRKCV